MFVSGSVAVLKRLDEFVYGCHNFGGADVADELHGLILRTDSSVLGYFAGTSENGVKVPKSGFNLTETCILLLKKA